MNVTKIGLDLIRRWEKLEYKAYLDGGGVPTIGYGHIKGVKLGDTCSDDQAWQWLKEDVTEAERIINSHVTAPLTQNQFDALVCFVFNIGSQFVTSTMLKLINAEEYALASLQFARWRFDNGKDVKGLLNRRMAEKALFETPA